MTSTLTSKGQRLTPTEAERLWRRWKEERDVRARDRLVLSYTPMVRFIATRKLRELPAHCDLDDLESAGIVALIEAVERFDPAKGASFEQYAWTRVAGSLVDELRRQDWAPRSVRRTGRAIERARATLLVRNGLSPSAEELARELALTLEELRTAIEEIELAELTSLNAPARGTDDSAPAELGDSLAGPASSYPEGAALASERNAAMSRAISRLSERERQVLAYVHVEELSGLEIGRRLGVSESRVSQILAGVRRKLKEQLLACDVAVAA